jgi:DNA polymerase-1
MIAHYLINPDMRHNMDILAETYLKYSPKPIEELKREIKSLRDVN